MIIFVTCPRKFTKEHNIELIQKNAILSWKNLKIDKKIILSSDEEGCEEFCKKYDVIYEPNVEKNKWGTPLVRSIMQNGVKYAKDDDIICFINADIILLNDFSETILNLENRLKRIQKYLLIGNKKNIKQLIDFENEYISKICLNELINDRPSGKDYFIFSRHTYNFNNIPDFAIGKYEYDSWIVGEAEYEKNIIIDITNNITALHQVAPWYIDGKFVERNELEYIKNSEVIYNMSFKNSRKSKRVNIDNVEYYTDINYNIIRRF